MKLIIAGSRDLNVTTEQIKQYLEKFELIPTEIVSGGARGIDSCAIQYAKDTKGLLAVFEADWQKNGKSAGPIRNLAMALYADRLLLIWDGKSKGSSNMKARMVGLKKPIYEIILNGEVNA